MAYRGCKERNGSQGLSIHTDIGLPLGQGQGGREAGSGGQIADKAALRDGDLIRLGQVVLRFYERHSVDAVLHDKLRNGIQPRQDEIWYAVRALVPQTMQMLQTFQASYPLVTVWQENAGQPTALNRGIAEALAARGNRVVDGVGMLLHQAVRGFSLWFGVTPKVTRELHDLIARDIDPGYGA